MLVGKEVCDEAGSRGGRSSSGSTAEGDEPGKSSGLSAGKGTLEGSRLRGPAVDDVALTGRWIWPAAGGGRGRSPNMPPPSTLFRSAWVSCCVK